MKPRWALKVKYDPNQPRVPAGSSEGGRWAASGQVNVAESRRLAGVVGAKKKDCWRNAALAAITTSGTYVEGHATMPQGVAFEHGWVELDGKILDPTLALFGEWPEGYNYFPGRKYSAEEVEKKPGPFPLSGYRDEAYQRSMREAWASLGVEM